jgi:hypothetical protein
MQDLDNFILPIPGFKGDILIPAIPISTRNPNVESSEDPSTVSSASASRPQASKRKALIDPNPLKGPRRLMGNLQVESGLNILCLQLLHQHLHRGVKTEFQSSDQKGTTCLEDIFLPIIL